MNPLKNWLLSDRFFLLLIVVVVTLILLPTIDSPGIQRLLGFTSLVLVFAMGATANRQRPIVFAMAIFVAAVSVALMIGRYLLGIEILEIPRLIASTIFFALTAVMILVAVVLDHMATRQAVYGAICTYLLMGLAWAHGYQLIERIETDAFEFAHRRPGIQLSDGTVTTAAGQMTYYSFVTLTTLGFGDILPRGPIAETATWMEAVTGQLFIAILIARLISELPTMRSKPT